MMAISEGRHRRYCDGIVKARDDFFQANPMGPDLIDVQADAAIAEADQDIADVLRIVSEVTAEANDFGGLDLNDLVTRLGDAGYSLPEEETDRDDVATPLKEDA